MRVMLVTGSFPPLRCGVGDYSAKLAAALARLPEVSVHVVTSKGAEQLGVDGGATIAARLEGWGLGGVPLILRVIRRLRPDVVHVQYPTQGYGRGILADLLPLLARFAGSTVVVTWHEPFGRRQIPPLLMQLAAAPVALVVRANFRELLNRWIRWLLRNKPLTHLQGGSALPIARLNEDERRALHRHYARDQSRLVVFFGFLYPHKGAELLFDIADPSTDQLVIAGDLATSPKYSEFLQQKATDRWEGKVTFTGFISASSAAELLAVADAVVLPFRQGSGDWNSSMHAARANGAYVITTSSTRRGLDRSSNTYFAAVDDVAAMRQALVDGGSRPDPDASHSRDDRWDELARQHVEIYRQVLNRPIKSESMMS